MLSCVSKNSKTEYSVDFTSNCPKRREGKPCSYCYVECARNMGFNAKKVFDYVPYNNEISRFTQKKISMLNAAGGIRLFSFGDYMPEHYNDVLQFLDDCEIQGLKVKVITKVIDFVVKFHDHPAIKVINISIDNVGDGVGWYVAGAFKKYSKVRVRCVVLKDEDVDAFTDCRVGNLVDVFTFNHGRGLKKLGYKMYSKKDVKEWNKKLNGKVCCSTGKCATCNLKCAQ